MLIVFEIKHAPPRCTKVIFHARKTLGIDPLDIFLAGTDPLSRLIILRKG